MFSGIVEAIGKVVTCSESISGRRLVIDAPGLDGGCRLGSSVAVNGACLTVRGSAASRLEFDVVAETLRCTNLGELKPHDRVNLERSLRVGDRIDGHFVQGHVDGRGTLTRREESTSEFVLWVEPEAKLRSYILRKGSIAIDGVSLTVASWDGTRLSVAIIPTTLQRTTLGERQCGDCVNLESDMIMRATVAYLGSLDLNRAAGDSHFILSRHP